MFTEVLRYGSKGAREVWDTEVLSASSGPEVSRNLEGGRGQAAWMTGRQNGHLLPTLPTPQGGQDLSLPGEHQAWLR